MGGSQSKVTTSQSENFLSQDNIVHNKGCLLKFIQQHQERLTSPIFCLGLAIVLICLMIGLSFLLLLVCSQQD